eukprot:4624988-Prymnesium_polylepis.1
MRRTPTSQKSSGGPYVGVELRGNGPAMEHLATGTEAVNRRMASRFAGVICFPGPGGNFVCFSGFF